MDQKCGECGNPNILARGKCSACYYRNYRKVGSTRERAGDLLTANAAARYCGFKSHSSIWRLRQRGKLKPAKFIDGRPLYSKTDLDRVKAR